jgi:hypothetical protein
VTAYLQMAVYRASGFLPVADDEAELENEKTS